ncbi:MAG: hypothetical protein DYG89_43605 [Caldilinea sp. CFX5]|nr:hypothetical protein [Caldilinea sp. CFX5]
MFKVTDRKINRRQGLSDIAEKDIKRSAMFIACKFFLCTDCCCHTDDTHDTMRYPRITLALEKQPTRMPA